MALFVLNGKNKAERLKLKAMMPCGGRMAKVQSLI